MNCEKCVHEKICGLWRAAESQDASCYDETCFEEKGEARCEILERMVKEYQDVIVPGYREQAQAAEARVHELETAYRLEKCEDGPECAELGKARKALAAAEARAEKAETQLRDAKHCVAGLSMLIKAVDGKTVMGTVLPIARYRLEKYKEKYPSAKVVLDTKKENEHGIDGKQHDPTGVSGGSSTADCRGKEGAWKPDAWNPVDADYGVPGTARGEAACKDLPEQTSI